MSLSILSKPNESDIATIPHLTAGKNWTQGHLEDHRVQQTMHIYLCIHQPQIRQLNSPSVWSQTVVIHVRPSSLDATTKTWGCCGMLVGHLNQSFPPLKALGVAVPTGTQTAPADDEMLIHCNSMGTFKASPSHFHPSSTDPEAPCQN